MVAKRVGQEVKYWITCEVSLDLRGNKKAPARGRGFAVSYGVHHG